MRTLTRQTLRHPRPRPHLQPVLPHLRIMPQPEAAADRFRQQRQGLLLARILRPPVARTVLAPPHPKQPNRNNRSNSRAAEIVMAALLLSTTLRRVVTMR